MVKIKVNVIVTSVSNSPLMFMQKMCACSYASGLLSDLSTNTEDKKKNS